MKLLLKRVIGATSLCGAMVCNYTLAAQPEAEVSIGAGVFYSKAPYAKWKGDEVTPFPFFTYKKGNFYMDGTGVGYTVLSNEEAAKGYYFDVVASTQIGIGYKSKDSVALKGMKDRDDIAVELGATLGYYNNYGLVELTLVQDVAGAHEGVVSQLTYSLPFGSENSGFQFVPYVKATYNSEKYNNYYYGVAQGEALVNRTYYRVKADIDAALGLNVYYEFDEFWSIAINAEYKQLGDEVKQSPIVAEDNIVSAFVGLNYSF